MSVPSALDLVNGPDKQILGIDSIRQEMGRPFALPPGVPADRIAMLRRAFEDTMRDPAFIAEAAKVSLEIDPLTGQKFRNCSTKPMAHRKQLLRKRQSWRNERRGQLRLHYCRGRFRQLHPCKPFKRRTTARKCLLLEAGGPDRHPYLHIRSGWDACTRVACSTWAMTASRTRR